MRYSINVSAGSKVINGVRCPYCVLDKKTRERSFHPTLATAQHEIERLKGLNDNARRRA